MSYKNDLPKDFFENDPNSYSNEEAAKFRREKNRKNKVPVDPMIVTVNKKERLYLIHIIIAIITLIVMIIAIITYKLPIYGVYFSSSATIYYSFMTIISYNYDNKTVRRNMFTYTIFHITIVILYAVLIAFINSP